jgi:hypothetical protein
MSGVGKSGSALVGNREYILERQPAGSSLIAFKPMNTKANSLPLRTPAKVDSAPWASVGAEVIPFRPRRFLTVAQSATGAPAGKHANTDDDRHCASSDSDWRLGIIEDFVALAWVVASMTAVYYMLTALSTVS